MEDGEQREVEKQRMEYLRRHREQMQLRIRLEAERRVEELETDVASMRARRDEVRAAKLEKHAHSQSLPGIYTRFGDLNEEELQILANRCQVSTRTQLNQHGKYHIRFMKDTYPIAGSQLRLEKEREMEITAKKKLLFAGASSLNRRKSNCCESRVLSLLGLEQALGHSKLEHYGGKFTAQLKNDQEQLRRNESERQIRLCKVQHRQGMEQFWKLMHGASKREVISWLKFHSFLDVNVPVRIVSKPNIHDITVCEDRNLGVTPLMTACRSLCVDLVRCLLECGAAVWLATANGDTALHFLWRDWILGSTDTVKDVAKLMQRSHHVQDILVALIAQGADVNAKNVFGETALQFCARYGLQDCAKLLLTHGADAFIRDRKGFSAVQYAHDNHYESLHQLLMHYKTIEQVRTSEKERHEANALLNGKRGALTASWFQTRTNQTTGNSTRVTEFDFCLSSGQGLRNINLP